MILSVSEAINVFFMGKSIEVYSAEPPNKTSTTSFSNEYSHKAYEYKQIVKVLFVWVSQTRHTTIDFRVENSIGGYGNLKVSVKDTIHILEDI